MYVSIHMTKTRTVNMLDFFCSGIQFYVLISFIYTIAIKLSIFYTIPIFEVMKNNLSFGFYSLCTLIFWLPNLDKFD